MRTPGAGCRATLGADVESLVGAHRVNAAEEYTRLSDQSVTLRRPCQSTCHNVARRFAKASEELLGAPRSPGPRIAGDTRGRRLRGAAPAAHGRCPPRGAVCGPRG